MAIIAMLLVNPGSLQDIQTQSHVFFLSFNKTVSNLHLGFLLFRVIDFLRINFTFYTSTLFPATKSTKPAYNGLHNWLLHQIRKNRSAELRLGAKVLSANSSKNKCDYGVIPNT